MLNEVKEKLVHFDLELLISCSISLFVVPVPPCFLGDVII